MLCLKRTLDFKNYFHVNFLSRNYIALSQNKITNLNSNTIGVRNNETKTKIFEINPILCTQHQKSFSSFNETITNFWQGVSNSTPVAYFQDGLIKIHDFTGLPWWATIVISTFLFRTTIIFPLAVYQVYL